MRAHTTRHRGASTLLAIGVIAVLAGTVAAVPPHPDLNDEIAAKTITLPAFLTDRSIQQSKGICTGCDTHADAISAATGRPYQTASAVGDFKVLAILVDFSDNVASTSATYFDSLIFDSAGATIRDYFDEISYGQLDIVTDDLPSNIGWVRAPQTYAYYVDSGYGTDSPYPNNSQGLFRDLIDAVDPQVDFSQYDNNNDGAVDVVMIIHAGRGAEKSGSVNDIWSHKWALYGTSGPVQRDGVWLADYTVQAEYHNAPGDMTIGVYSHELAHGFGLPDLYDIDNDAYGIGDWGLMSYGAWLGPTGHGESPAHPCAWSKIEMGFLSPTVVANNLDSQAIPNVQFNQSVFRLWNAGTIEDEYFLVENRQKIGYDAYLPDEGLLIWHIDDGEATSNNTDNADQWYPPLSTADHLRVALEQADGMWDIEKKTISGNKGDNGDVFKAVVGRDRFDGTTTPNSHAYSGSTSYIGVQDITASNDTIFADLLVALSSSVDDPDPIIPQEIALQQNYPNPFNPETTIDFSVAAESRVQLEIFNILGERVRVLLDETVPAGTQTVAWDGSNETGVEVASGLYFYRLTAADLSETRKMVLLR